MKDLLLIFLSLEENLPFSNDMCDFFPINSYSSQIFPYFCPYRLPRKNMNSEMFQYNRPTWYVHFCCSSICLHIKKTIRTDVCSIQLGGISTLWSKKSDKKNCPVFIHNSFGQNVLIAPSCLLPTCTKSILTLPNFISKN